MYFAWSQNNVCLGVYIRRWLFALWILGRCICYIGKYIYALGCWCLNSVAFKGLIVLFRTITDHVHWKFCSTDLLSYSLVSLPPFSPAKIDLPTFFDDPLKPKIMFNIAPYSLKKISTNIMHKKVNERSIMLPFSLLPNGHKNPPRLT